MANPYHEDQVSEESRDLHRALNSLQEELEAVDWYQQRADATANAELKAVLEHNRDEEIEHAAMLLEWLRRRMPAFNEELGTYLFKTLPITEIEEAGEGGGDDPAAAAPQPGDGSLGIGKLA